jgi:ketosteroid isomerase-like protein
MPSPLTPEEVLARRSEAILSGDAAGFVGLFAPDAVVESSFAGPPGTPLRLAGQEAIREYARRVMASPVRLSEFEVERLYQTQDPEVVIAEVRTSGTVATTGRPFATTSVQVIRIRDGRIAASRDYADPRILQELTSGQHQPG